MNRNIAALILLFALFACEFSPSEVPLSEIEEPPEIAPEISFELSPEMDTLKLSEDTWISYEVETGDRELYQIEVALDNTEIGNVNYESNQKVRAYIPASSLSDGIHQLKITTYTSTNSGSIADKIGSEAYGYELTWPVFINKEAKREFAFTTVEAIPEGIKINWTAYPYADFDHYELSISNYGSSGQIVNIEDPVINYYIDTNYIEGIYSNYTIKLIDKNSGFNIDFAGFNMPIEPPIVQVNPDCTVDLQWNRSKNESLVSQYCIMTSVPNYGTKEEHDLEDLNDTTLTLDQKIGFAGDYQAQLRYIPKGYDNYHSVLNTSGGVVTFALGDSIPRFEEAFRVVADNSLILYKNKTIFKYALETGESSEPITINPEGNGYTGMIYGSPDGNCFGYLENHKLVIRQSSDFSILSETAIDGFDGYNLQLNGISISNNGLIGTTDYFKHFCLYDASTGQKLLEKEYGSDFYPRKVLISGDGKNLAVMANIYSKYTTDLIYYQFDGTQLTELGSVSGVLEDSWEVQMYGPAETNQLVVSHWNNMYDYLIEIRDSRTFELIYSASVPTHFVPVAYDFATERAITQYHAFPVQKYSYLFDLKTGQRTKAVFFSGREPLLFHNGTVFAGNGRSIPIDEYLSE